MTQVYDRAKAERILSDIVTRLEKVLGTVKYAVNIIALDGTVLWHNDALKDVPPYHHVGKKCWKTFEHRESRCPHCVHPDIIATGEPREYETEGFAPDGSRRSLNVYAAPLKDDSGQIYAIVETSTDITDRRRAEEELRDRENILRESQRTANMGSWTWDLKTNDVTWSDNLCLMHGITLREFDGQFNTILSLVHPEDRASVKQTIQQLLRGKKTFEFEYRIKARNGDVKSVLGRQQLFLDDEGDIVRMLGVIQDITDRKQAEETLHETTTRLQGILDTTQDPVNIIDPEGNILWRSASSIDWRADVANRKCWEFFEGRESRCPHCVHSDILRDGKPRDYETRVTDPDGTLVDLWVSAVPMRDASGRIYAVLETNRDITERNRAKEQIAASLKEKEVLLREIHHRVKNNMQVIVSLLRMHSRRIDDARVGEVFDECRDRISAMALVHEALYQSKNLAQIDFEGYIRKLCRNLSEAYDASGRGIAMMVGRCNVALNMDQGIAVGMVLCELVANAFKHAFPPGKSGKVSVSLSDLNEEEIELVVQDDGIGLPAEITVLDSPSLGLELAAATVMQELGGSIDVERDGGTRFVIRFKCKSA
ncbi:PAS domain S-box protein [Candidatus Hydrogenedentota bacterium]